MDADSTTDEAAIASRNRYSFTIGNLLMLIALVAISIAWWIDHSREALREYDISGPISVSYSVRTSPTSTLGYELAGVQGVDFRGDSIVLYTKDGGKVLSASSLIEFSWRPDS